MDRLLLTSFPVLCGVISVCLLGLLRPGSLCGQAPLSSANDLNLETEQSLVLDWQIDSANAILEAGLAATAEDLFRSILASPGLSIPLAAEARLRLAVSLIGQRRFDAANAELDLITDPYQDSSYYLYRAATAYADGRDFDRQILLGYLGEVDSVDLSEWDLPWFYLIEGLIVEESGTSATARDAFERARSAAVSDLQRSYFEGLILREKLLETPANEALAVDIRLQLEQFQGQQAEFNFAREYAIILHNMGRSVEAIEVIDQSVAGNAGYTRREYEQLRLLKGVILGAGSEEGRATLEGIIRSGEDREVMGIALQLLARSYDPTNARLPGFLNEMIARATPHPLLSQFYYIRSQLALVADDAVSVSAAEKDARKLLDQFPGFSEISNVYRLLAYAALQREPAQYRAAADFLIQLRDQTEALDTLWRLNLLIGDCYFLNKDYANAVDFYKAARSGEARLGRNDNLFLRLITAEVRSGNLESAQQLIDQADFTGGIEESDRWRAEWNLALALQSSGQVDAALQRVRSLLNDNRAGSGAAALDLRLSWLAARLALTSGEVDGLGEQVETLLRRIDALPQGALDQADAELLTTEILLLQADVKIRGGETQAAIVLLEALRADYPQSSAAVRSYLTEANYYASTGDSEAAQKTLTALVSIYPQSEFAPQALYEAALYCETRGPESYEEAIRLYHELAQKYPDDALMLPAKLKQGDLLRLMNEFAGAQRIYENLINEFPEHPRRYVAELSRADCLLALAKENAAQLDAVVLTLERLMDVPNLPIAFQAEAGYKWGFTLQQRDEPEKAREVLSTLIGELLLKTNSVTQLGPTGRYWMSRSLFDLGQLYEDAGDPDEARLIYLKILAFNLPGRSIVEGKLASL